jgi:hypothetical protein
METMSLPRHYQTIIVPSSSFQLIVDPVHALETMLRLFTHLLPGGMLVMPFMKLWKDEFINTWRLTGEKVRPKDGAVVKRWSRNRYDPETQMEHTEDRYEVIMDGITIANEYHARSPATREYSQQQAQDLYTNAGFVDICIYKGFTRIPASLEDEIFSITGKRPREICLKI